MKDSKKSFPFKSLIILVFLTFLSYIIGIFTGNKFLLPILNISPAYPFMIYLILKDKRKEAVYSMLLWALYLIFFGTIVFSIFPERAEKVVINGKAYKEEMFDWIKTGIGRESNPKEFIPQHLAHIGIFIFLSLISASLFSIIMGSIMVNYMNFYVAQLIINSKNKIVPIIFGWHFWSLIRVISFVILGVLLSEPLLSLIKKKTPQILKEKTMILIAISGLILDIALKTIFSPLVGRILKTVLF